MAVEPNDLLDLKKESIGQVKSMVRFAVTNEFGEVTGYVKPLETGSIQASTSGNIKRTLDSILLNASDYYDINAYRDRLSPAWVLEDGTEWPMGVFVFTGAQLRPGTYASTVELQMYDQDFILDQNTKQTFSIASGGVIADGIIAMASQVLIGNRYVEYNPSKIIQDPVNWPAGTSRKRIIGDLCNLAGLLPPYFDNTGKLIVRSAPSLDDSLPDHMYAKENSRILRASIVENYNLLTAPNVHLVVASGPASGEIVAEASVDPALPFSSQNRLFEIVEVHRQQGVVDTNQAAAMARQFAQITSDAYLIVEFDAFPDPRHDLFQIINWEGANYRETGWSLTLTPGGPHKHTMTRGGFPDA